jgi:hypothetical protein
MAITLTPVTPTKLGPATGVRSSGTLNVNGRIFQLGALARIGLVRGAFVLSSLRT